MIAAAERRSRIPAIVLVALALVTGAAWQVVEDAAVPLVRLDSACPVP